MPRITLAVLGLALFVPATHAAPALKDRKDEDAARIVGQWAQESMSSRGGEPIPPRQSSTFRFNSDGTCGITTGTSESPAQYTLDLSRSPRQLKWLHGPTKTEWLCVYELEGDKLKLAFVDSGTEPLKKIEPAKNLTVYYLKRIKD